MLTWNRKAQEASTLDKELQAIKECRELGAIIFWRKSPQTGRLFNTKEQESTWEELERGGEGRNDVIIISKIKNKNK